LVYYGTLPLALLGWGAFFLPLERGTNMPQVEYKELTATQYVFLTLGAGLTLQKGDKVFLKKDLAVRTVKELSDRVTLSDEVQVAFVDGDVTVGSDLITKTAHGLVNGQQTRFDTDGVLPVGLASGTTYFVVEATANTYKVSLTDGGAAVDITSAAGGGNHTAAKMAKLKHSTFELVPA